MTRAFATPFRVGARGSALSVAQTRGAIRLLAEAFPGLRARLVKVSTPGDRDLATPIEKSAPDFFTRDLDEAVRRGRVDFAVHSAKDLPERLPDDLDWFWLPAREDPRDAWVAPEDVFASRFVRSGARLKIGVSSERRAAYVRKRFPKALLPSIRGSIDARLAQLADGRFDAVLMAMAGIRRLYRLKTDASGRDFLVVKGHRLIVQPIPVADLEPPEAQGFLAVTFRKGDDRMMHLREKFVKAVRFTSAGVGDAALVTVQGARDVAQADVVLYDDLLGLPGLVAREDLPDVRFVPVGKRCGAHSMKQREITRLICDEARKGRRVVRLKGGDAGLFGRLAEETDALTELRIPFVVRPGVSALTAATTGTGMLLTRRGESKGFSVYTPRSAAPDQTLRAADAPTPRAPLVAFMAAKVAADEARRLMAEGWAKSTPCALVYDAAGPREEVLRATLGRLAAHGTGREADARPGLFVVGAAAAHAWPRLGEFRGRRVLVTCSEAVQERACRAVEDRGGRPISWPLIRLEPRARLVCPPDRAHFDWIVLTSPSAARLFFSRFAGDRRRLPAFATCGAGTDAELRRWGVASDLMPARDFSAAGLAAEIARRDWKGQRVLRLRSAKAGDALARAFAARGAAVDDVVLYDNVPVRRAEPPPAFDDVFFASASAVEVFRAQYGEAALAKSRIFVMGEPTRRALGTRLARRVAGTLQTV